MVTFSHVLFPTDLSDPSLRAASFAAAIARWYDARLTVLHVVPTFEPVTVPSEAGYQGVTVQPPAPEEVRRQMTQAVPGDALAGLDVRFEPTSGDPVRVIANRARADAVDLIVMGTHGRSGFDRLMTGSVTERVLRTAPCPVLTIPPHAAPAAEGGPLARILCAVDFSPASEAALRLALDLARQSNGAVTVLHAVEWLEEEEPRAHAHFNVSEYRRYLRQDVKTRLDSLLTNESREWCDIDTMVTFGRAHREVLRVAHEQGTDLIVMGAQGRGGMGLALFGSATPPVVRDAACPVLVVRGSTATE
ncbi:MAG: universal stress protein [Dehalococcoidia bacterium]